MNEELKSNEEMRRLRSGVLVTVVFPVFEIAPVSASQIESYLKEAAETKNSGNTDKYATYNLVASALNNAARAKTGKLNGTLDIESTISEPLARELALTILIVSGYSSDEAEAMLQ